MGNTLTKTMQSNSMVKQSIDSKVVKSTQNKNNNYRIDKN